MKQLNNSNLDERQEMVLLTIEHKACWLAFYGLLISILVQSVILGSDFKTISGEWIVFMIMAVYLTIECIRNDIWDRKLRPDNKTNILTSLVAGGVMFVLVGTASYFRYTRNLGISLLIGLSVGAVVFLMCYAMVSLSAHIYKRRIAKLEEESDEDEEI